MRLLPGSLPRFIRPKHQRGDLEPLLDDCKLARVNFEVEHLSGLRLFAGDAHPGALPPEQTLHE